MARTSYKPDEHNWLVIAPLRKVVVKAVDEDEAKLLVLRLGGPPGTDLSTKPYLARDWIVRIASDDEVRRYAVWADNVRPSQPTWKTVKNPRKPTQERLV